MALLSETFLKNLKQLTHLLFALLLIVTLKSIGDAMGQVAFEQSTLQASQRSRDRAGLREDVGTVSTFDDHALNAVHLTFNSANTVQISGVVRMFGHSSVTLT